MPELPEVQTIINDLQDIVGDCFTDFISYWPKSVKKLSPSKFAKKIANQKIKSVSRLGKIILIKINDEKHIAVHLKMTGKLILNDDKKAVGKFDQKTKSKHLHHVFYLKKFGALEFHDIRKFGTISLLNGKDISSIQKNYGVDPIADAFSLEDLFSLLKKGKERPIKEVLMNNKLILGIGNIYASEILFDINVLPARKASSLIKEEIKKMHLSIKKILLKAIKLRGTSVSDYRDARGKKGTFQNHLFVYKKDTQKCKKCATIIARSMIAQRSSFYCPACQK